VISTIRLQNFRSYTDDSFEFEPGVNIVVGPNASGKTNLLEAVLVLARGNSYRARDTELIKFDKAWARLDGYFNQQSRALKLEKADKLIDKTYLLEDKAYKRLSLEKTAPVVYFEPNHLQLITRGPDQRRDYFDELLERSVTGFKSVAASYYRTLAQRNALLKRGPAAGKQQLFAWNIRLSELGEKIAQAREDLAAAVNGELEKTYRKISKKKIGIEFIYKSQFSPANYGSRMLRKLETNLEEDYQKGFTSHGPHREDYLITIGGQPANITASRGESRSLILALKIFELGLIEKVRDQRPIFLLDDVFSELDGARRQALVNYLKKRQTIITTTDAESVIEHFAAGNQKLISLR
jgi:DNA replication and repair protein RecF